VTASDHYQARLETFGAERARAERRFRTLGNLRVLVLLIAIAIAGIGFGPGWISPRSTPPPAPAATTAKSIPARSRSRRLRWRSAAPARAGSPACGNAAPRVPAPRRSFRGAPDNGRKPSLIQYPVICFPACVPSSIFFPRRFPTNPDWCCAIRSATRTRR